MSDVRHNRRTVIGATAWSVPAIVVASAAPAAAVSASPGPVVNLGTSGTQLFTNPQGTFYDVVLRDVTITPSSAVAAGTLALVVTFQPSASYPEGSHPGLAYVGSPSGWTPSSTAAASSYTYTYSAAIPAGSTIAIPTGVYFGTNYQTNRQQGQGVFTFAVSAPGSTTSFVTLATPQQQVQRLSRSAEGAAPRSS
ncbi:hypothetical protein [Nocardioides alkalitolerans]|uniref:hypothetical protein n=1 Tax=Nocardioides alkalitolerans TaxID=281714 RepID=UPI0004087352|nr:hypothetical protein [Nocardioides alkalitolerans]